MLAGTLSVSPGAYAAEQWSTELWSESPGQGETPGSGSSSDWDWWWGADDASGGGSPGSGLWSDDLWSEPPAGSGPREPSPTAPDPGPKPAPEPKPTPEPEPQRPAEPEEKPGPAGPSQPVPSDVSNTITMQIGSSTAFVRGKETAMSVPPFTINGRAMIPLRFIGEALQADVTWSEAEQKVTLELQGKKAQLWVNRTEAILDGKTTALDFPPMVLNGATLVPLRFVGEFFGYRVEYDGATEKIAIVDPTTPVPEPSPEPEQPKPVPEDNGFDYFGTWELRAEGRDKGIEMGKLIVSEDGVYGIASAGNGVVTGTWRRAAKDEVIGQDHALILENGPTGVDWALIPKQDGLVSVRYHYGYTGETKIWFEYSLGIQVDE